ncbi:unnamed protein product [Polarella glacialis]|uniref:Uncharacterized protein n=1 Tax=Polarella glacialis TaxID=89957 RepID=A0A813DGE5_POLGL|nr:unnamed protein product [Polarella glacialis]
MVPSDGVPEVSVDSANSAFLKPAYSFSLANLNSAMVEQLNQMCAFMGQAMTQERARHSSDVSLILRKVDKDLRETFRHVHQTFATLTDQTSRLAQEVETGRKQVSNVKDKHARAKQAIEAQARYVTELEKVVDGHQKGASSKIKELTYEVTTAKQALKQAEDRGRQKEQAFRTEIQRLQLLLKKHEASEAVVDLGGPPPMPEMSATWTQSSADSDFLGSGRSFVSTMQANCDAGRAVPRFKSHFGVQAGRAAARPKGRILTLTPSPSLGLEPSSPRPRVAPGESLKERVELLEARCARLQRLLVKASSPLMLLSDVFADLRESGCFGVVEVTEGGVGPGLESSRDRVEAKQILGSLARRFRDSAPKLRGLSDLVMATCAEAARCAPPGDDLEVAAAEAAGREEARQGRVCEEPAKPEHPAAYGSESSDDRHFDFCDKRAQQRGEGTPSPALDGWRIRRNSWHQAHSGSSQALALDIMTSHEEEAEAD